MSPRILRAACALTLALSVTSCFTVDHFTGDPTRYDGLYFGDDKDAPVEPPLHADQWRNYAVYGLIAWDESQTRYAGERLSQVGGDRRPMDVAVRSEMTFLNGLTSFGLSLLTGPFGALFFVPRSIEVSGWEG